MENLGFGIVGLGLGFENLGFGSLGLGLGFENLGFGILGLGLGFGNLGLGPGLAQPRLALGWAGSGLGWLRVKCLNKGSALSLAWLSWGWLGLGWVWPGLAQVCIWSHIEFISSI